MPISYELDRAARIVRITAHGDVSFPEEKECLDAFLADSTHQPGFRILLDDRERMPAASSAHVKAMASLFELNRQAIGAARLAIVVAKDVSFGLARMFSMLTDNSLVETRVFRDIDEAEQWLDPNSDDSAAC